MQSQKPKNGCGIQIVYGVMIFGCGGFFYLLIFPNPFGPSPKQAAKQTACLSNLKQLGRASMEYCADNNEAFPAYFTFDGELKASQYMTSLKPYLKLKDYDRYSPFICAFDYAALHVGIPITGEHGGPKMSYVHNSSLSNIIPNFSNGKRILKASDATDPTTTVSLRDGILETLKGVPQSRHGDNMGFNFLFLDGHVKRKKENYIGDL